MDAGSNQGPINAARKLEALADRIARERSIRSDIEDALRDLAYDLRREADRLGKADEGQGRS